MRGVVGPSVPALALCILGLAAGSPTVATSGPVAVLLAGCELGRRRSRAARRYRARALPAVVDHLIQQLRSGCSLRQGCLRLADLDAAVVPEPLAPFLDALAAGRTLVEAADRLAADPDRSIRLLAVTLRVLATNGGPAVPALQRLRHSLIGAVHAGDRTAAEAGQALASAGLLAAAPGLFAVVVAAVDGRVARLYLFEPLGAGCVFAALVLSTLGWWWMQRLIDSAADPWR